MCRSSRLAQNCITCSLTPRSGKYHAEALANAKTTSHVELLYTEAKLAMSHREMDDAYFLFKQCEQCCSGYKNVHEYLLKCESFFKLRRDGIVQRVDRDGLRVKLAGILGESEETTIVNRYFNKLIEAGYTRAHLDALTLSSVDAMATSAGMRKGHYELMWDFATLQTDWSESLMLTLTQAFAACTHSTTHFATMQKVLAGGAGMVETGEEEEEEEEEFDLV